MKKLVLFSGPILLAGSLYAASGGGIGPQTEPKKDIVTITVYNADTVAHEVGDVVVWKDGSVADGLEISTTVTANNTLVAGVVVNRTIAASSWGQIQTHGYCSAITIGVANSAGDALVTSTTGEAAMVNTSSGAAVGYGTPASIFAVALEATTSSTTVKGFIIK